MGEAKRLRASWIAHLAKMTIGETKAMRMSMFWAVDTSKIVLFVSFMGDYSGG